jgi:NADH-quinone oxidoreductase subunit M
VFEMNPYPLVQIVVVPVITVPITYWAGRKVGEKIGWVTFVTLAYTTLLASWLGLTMQGAGPFREEFVWVPSLNLKFGLLLDGLNLPILLTISFLCTIIAVYSMTYMHHSIGESPSGYASYFSLYQLYAAGMMGTVLATNLIEFYLFFELMLVPSWALINSFGTGEKERIALMYFMWTHVGAVCLLAGILSAYAKLGTFEISSLSLLQGDPIAIWISVAMLIGFLTKMAVFGLHIWLPYAHAEAPTPISALLSPAMIGIGAYASVRIVVASFPETFASIGGILSLWALVTMIYGGLMALAQDDIKRLLAYSSVSQMGYLLLGIASSTEMGITGSMFHYVSHATCKGILFLVAGVLIYQVHGIRSIKKLGGLAAKMPITTIAFILGFLGIAGTPPLNGFQSEWILFSGVFAGALQRSPTQLAIAIAALASTVLTAGYALWTVRRIFFGPLPEHLQDVKEAPPTMTIPLIVLAVVSIILGIYPRLVTDFLFPSIARLLGLN